MATSIFSLFGEVFVDNDKANKSIEDTKKKGQSLGDTLGKAFKTVGTIGTAITGAATAAGTAVFNLAKNASDTADHIDKASQSLGMSAEAYQEWDYVLGQNGASIDNLGTAMKNLTKTIDGSSKTGSDALKRMGINIEGLNQEEVFAATVKGLQGITDSNEKAALAQELYGKSYQELMPLLNQSAEGTAELTNRAHELGLVLSDESVSAGAAFGDTLDDLKKSFGGIFTVLGAELMPMITDAMNFIINNVIPRIRELVNGDNGLLPKIKEFMSRLVPLFFDVVDKILPVVFNLGEKIIPIIANLVEKLLPPMLKIFDELWPIFEDLFLGDDGLIAVALELLEPILDIFDDLFGGSDGLGQAMLDVIKDLTPFLKQVVGFAADLAEKLLPLFKPTLELISKSLQAVVEAIDLVIEGARELMKLLDIDSEGKASKETEELQAKIATEAAAVRNKTPVRQNDVTADEAMAFIEANKGSLKSIGSHATGLSYVPYNGYAALLHEGEAVLTRSEAENFRSGSGSVINIYDAKVMNPDDVDYLIDLMTTRLSQLGVSPI